MARNFFKEYDETKRGVATEESKVLSAIDAFLSSKGDISSNAANKADAEKDKKLMSQVNEFLKSLRQKNSKPDTSGNSNSNSDNSSNTSNSSNSFMNEKTKSLLNAMNRGATIDLSAFLKSLENKRSGQNNSIKAIDTSKIKKSHLEISKDSINLDKLIFHKDMEVDTKELVEFLKEMRWYIPSFEDEELLKDLFGWDLNNISSTRIVGLKDFLANLVIKDNLPKIKVSKTLIKPSFSIIDKESYWDLESLEYNTLGNTGKEEIRIDIVQTLRDLNLYDAYDENYFNPIPSTDRTKKYFGNEATLWDMGLTLEKYSTDINSLLEKGNSKYKAQFKDEETEGILYDSDNNKMKNELRRFATAKIIMEQKRASIRYNKFHNRPANMSPNTRRDIKMPTTKSVSINNTAFPVNNNMVVVTGLTKKEVTVSSNWNTTKKDTKVSNVSLISSPTTEFTTDLRSFLESYTESGFKRIANLSLEKSLESKASFMEDLIIGDITKPYMKISDLGGYKFKVIVSDNGQPAYHAIRKVIRVGNYESYVKKANAHFKEEEISNWPNHNRTSTEFNAIRSLLMSGPDWSPNTYNAMFTTGPIGSFGKGKDASLFDISTKVGNNAPNSLLDRDSDAAIKRTNKGITDLWYVRLNGINIPTPSFESYTTNFLGRTIQKVSNRVIENHKLTLTFELDNNMNLLKHFLLLSGINGHSLEKLEEIGFKEIYSQLGLNSTNPKGNGMFIPYSLFPPLFSTKDVQVNLEVVFNDFRKGTSLYTEFFRGITGTPSYATPKGSMALAEPQSYKQFTLEGVKFLGIGSELKFNRDSASSITIDVPIVFKRILYNNVTK